MLPLLLSVLFVLPTDTVTGRVVDNGGQAVPQAIVEITQLGKSVTAGADGAFRLALAHVVATLPGVNAITTGSQIGKPMIRGFSGPRVLVLENGNRLEDYSWSDEDGPSVETAFVRRVELIRGPASVLYGSDALGGVI